MRYRDGLPVASCQVEFAFVRHCLFKLRSRDFTSVSPSAHSEALSQQVLNGICLEIKAAELQQRQSPALCVYRACKAGERVGIVGRTGEVLVSKTNARLTQACCNAVQCYCMQCWRCRKSASRLRQVLLPVDAASTRRAGGRRIRL